MLQLTTQSPTVFTLSTEDNRCYTHTLDAEHLVVPKTQIRFLFKIVSEMSNVVSYVYPSSLTIYDRYSIMTINVINTTADMFAGQVKLEMSGHYTYEVYEVSWGGTVVVSETTAPATETHVFDPASNTKGVVRGLVTKGTMYVDDKAGTEQVQYSEYVSNIPDTGTIYYGQ